MKLLNRHTTVPVERTAAEIQAALVQARAQAVLMEYADDGVLTHISFRVMTKQGLVSFRLPANVNGVHSLLKGDPTMTGRMKTRDHAARVAWRTCKIWVLAQLAMLDAGMAELPEVFLAYAQLPGGETVYERFKQDGLPALGHDPQKALPRTDAA